MGRRKRSRIYKKRLKRLKRLEAIKQKKKKAKPKAPKSSTQSKTTPLKGVTLQGKAKQPSATFKGITSKATPTTSLTKTQSLLFSLFIFLIPTNLSLNFFKDTAFVNGILVDYLLPKLYFSDLVIVALLLPWLFRNLQFLLQKLKSLHNTYYLLLATLIVSAITSPKPLASFWYLLKLVEMLLLILWLRSNQINLHQIRTPLKITLAFQSIIAILQWAQKKSILGYLFLGETTIRTTSNIAKSAFRGELRPLPYGTTAHPNILAGFVAISLIILYLSHTKTPPKSTNVKGRTLHAKAKIALSLISHFLLVIFALTALLLTQSIIAGTVLLIGLTLIKLKTPKKVYLTLITALTITATLIITPNLDQTSITRRLQLNTIGLQILKDRPILGTGPNNFTAVMSSYGEISGTTRFFQPIHNIYLLWIVETGLAGSLALAYVFWKYKKEIQQFCTLHFALCIPVLMVFTIGLADHYPLTLQTGQLLFVTTAALCSPALKPNLQRD